MSGILDVIEWVFFYILVSQMKFVYCLGTNLVALSMLSFEDLMNFDESKKIESYGPIDVEKWYIEAEFVILRL